VVVIVPPRSRMRGGWSARATARFQRPRNVLRT